MFKHSRVKWKATHEREADMMKGKPSERIMHATQQVLPASSATEENIPHNALLQANNMMYHPL